MVLKIADNIYSPLGKTTEENYAAVKQGHSMLRSYPAGTMDLPEPFTASLFDWDSVDLIDGYTHFESIVIQSVRRALEQTDIDVQAPDVQFILSTTKGNVDLLDSRAPAFPPDRVLPGVSAQYIADYFGFSRVPLVVSNACISGLSAQITALRLLESGACRTAVVAGADVQSRFIISGFGSFKALSPQECRPFDIERIGLNLGEAAATIIYTNSQESSQRHTLTEPIANLGRLSVVPSATMPFISQDHRPRERVVTGPSVPPWATNLPVPLLWLTYTVRQRSIMTRWSRQLSTVPVCLTFQSTR